MSHEPEVVVQTVESIAQKAGANTRYTKARCRFPACGASQCNALNRGAECPEAGLECVAFAGDPGCAGDGQHCGARGWGAEPLWKNERRMFYSSHSGAGLGAMRVHRGHFGQSLSREWPLESEIESESESESQSHSVTESDLFGLRGRVMRERTSIDRSRRSTPFQKTGVGPRFSAPSSQFRLVARCVSKLHRAQPAPRCTFHAARCGEIQPSCEAKGFEQYGFGP